MQLTDYQAKYFAHELTKRCASDSVEKLCLNVNRRSLQRDIKGMLDKELISSGGETHHQEYRLR